MSKTAISLLILMGAAGSLAGCGAPAAVRGPQALAQTVNWPKRRAGLWQETLVHGGAMSPTRAALVCLGEGQITDISAIGRGWEHGDCQRTLTQSRDGAYHFNSACRLGGGTRITTKGVARGDFTTHYVLEADTQVEDAPIAALDGGRSLKIVGTYRGPCPVGMKPGKVARMDAPRILASAGG